MSVYVVCVREGTGATAAQTAAPLGRHAPRKPRFSHHGNGRRCTLESMVGRLARGPRSPSRPPPAPWLRLPAIAAVALSTVVYFAQASEPRLGPSPPRLPPELVVTVAANGSNRPGCGVGAAPPCATLAYAVQSVAAGLQPLDAMVMVQMAPGVYDSESCGVTTARPLELTGTAGGDSGEQ
jgi:hypothetical protein